MVIIGSRGKLARIDVCSLSLGLQLSEEPDAAASLASLLAGREDKVSVEISGYQTPLPEGGHIGQARVAASARSHLGLPRHNAVRL